jgi:hypothetical protein
MEKECKVIMLPTETPKGFTIAMNGEGKLYTTTLTPKASNTTYQHLYITSDDEIKEGDWVYEVDKDAQEQIGMPVFNVEQIYPTGVIKAKGTTAVIHINFLKKVIATTDSSLTTNACMDFMDCKHDCSRGQHPCVSETSLPQIPESFINTYVEANGDIDRMGVEFDEWDFTNDCLFSIESFDYPDIMGEYNFGLKLKLREDNTVIINIK